MPIKAGSRTKRIAGKIFLRTDLTRLQFIINYLKRFTDGTGQLFVDIGGACTFINRFASISQMPPEKRMDILPKCMDK